MRKKEFNTALRTSIKLTCESCAESWVSDVEPNKIKQGMIVIEDVCPSCGEYLSVLL